MSRTEDKKLQPVWGQLAKEIGINELPDPLRAELLREYEADIDCAIGTEDQEDLAHLVKVARSMYRAYLAPKKTRQGRRSTTIPDESIQEIVPEVGAYESLRAAALSEYLGKIATIDPKVAGFRSEVLAGEILTPAEAGAFLASPATRFLTPRLWQSHGVPAKHTARLVEEELYTIENGLSHFVQVRIDPPGVTVPLSWNVPSYIPFEESLGYLTCKIGDGRSNRVSFWPHSVLGKLHKFCKELVKAHPWNIDEAIIFVLTRESPSVRPIRAETPTSWVPGARMYKAITLTVEPWVSPETVERAYRQVQKQVTGGKAGRLGDKNLHLFRFVTERTDATGNLPKGRVLVEEWDKKWKQERPQWCYGPDTRRFWRDFRDVQKSMTNSKRAGLILEAGSYTP